MALEQCYGGAEGVVAFRKALEEAGTHAKGREILQFLADGGRPYDVCVLPENYPATAELRVVGQYTVVEGVMTQYAQLTGLPQSPDPQRPTVFWSPSCVLPIVFDVRGVEYDGTGGLKPKSLNSLRVGEYYCVTPGGVRLAVVQGTKHTMPSWLVLLHELGHAKQYYDPGVQGDRNQQWLNRNETAEAHLLVEEENLTEHERPLSRVAFGLERIRYGDALDAFQRLYEDYYATVSETMSAYRIRSMSARIWDDKFLADEARKNAGDTGIFRVGERGAMAEIKDRAAGALQRRRP